MTAQNRVHRGIDYLKTRYNAEHDIDVDFNWVDMELLNLVEDLQEQVEELATRIYKLEHSSSCYMDNDRDNSPYGKLEQG